MMTLNFTTKKSPEVVFGYLSDMQQLVTVHPVIDSITHLADNRHRVKETLKLG